MLKLKTQSQLTADTEAVQGHYLYNYNYAAHFIVSQQCIPVEAIIKEIKVENSYPMICYMLVSD